MEKKSSLNRFAMLAGAFFLFGAGAAFGAAGDDAKTGITVSGECLVKVAQDRASVVVASSVIALTPKEASEQAVRAHEAVKTAVKKLALKDSLAETEGYSVFEECSYPHGKKVCQGYRARLATRFETSDIGRVGEIIAAAAEGGSEEVSDLQTLVSPALMQREREACLEAATKNAFAKASKIAAGAGIKLGKLISISEVGGGGEGPVVPMMRTFGMSDLAKDSGASVPSVEARPVDVRVTVSALYAIE